MDELAGRTALITGASRGIGAGIARAFAARGMKVALNYRDYEAGARNTLISMAGDGHQMIRADVSNPDQVQALVLSAAEALGRLDVLVNNAGIYENLPFLMPDYRLWQDSWRRTLDTNLNSAANATYCALPIMKSGGGGKIINVASRSAFRGETDAPAYAVSKAGMVNLTRCLARAMAGDNIRAYCIAPGWVETAMAREGMTTRRDEVLSQIPLGRIASVEDVAGVALFLASDAADYLTGITIDVNGGSYLH